MYIHFLTSLATIIYMVKHPYMVANDVISYYYYTDDGELRRTLQSLSLGKQGTGGRVLIKTPKVELPSTIGYK